MSLTAPKPPSLFISCGEPSGDIHAAALLLSLRKHRPDLVCGALAGPSLRKAGVNEVRGIEELSVMGFTEVFSALPRALRMLGDIRRHLKTSRPNAVILVDAPEFNFRVARIAHELKIPAYYYISPKIWAWRTGRVHFLRKYIRKIISILPFEVDFYARYGVNVEYVGNPLVDIINLPALAAVAVNENNIGIMPGSRKKEIDSLLPEFGRAAQILRQKNPDLNFLCLRAPNVSANRLRSLWPASVPVSIIEPEERYRAIKSCNFMIAASGTATLECALIGTPTIAAYKVSKLTYSLGKLVVKARWMSLANWIFEETVLPELLQEEADGPNVAALAGRWLEDLEITRTMRNRLATLPDKLGPPGAADRAAAVILRDLGLESL